MLQPQLCNELQTYIEKHYLYFNVCFFDIDIPEASEKNTQPSNAKPETLSYIPAFKNWPEFQPQVDGQTFYEKLIAIMNKKKLDEVEVYNTAHLDRRLFSKLRKKNYHPSKNTVISLALALQLNLDEALDLLNYTGYALSSNSKSDVIIKFCFEKAIYDILEVNEALYAFNESTLWYSINKILTKNKLKGDAKHGIKKH